MLRLFLLSCLLIFGYTPTFSGDSLPPVISRLLAHPGNIIIHTQSKNHLLPLIDLPPSFKDSRQQYVKNKNGLFLMTEGTGRMYRLITNQTHYEWKRIDSTYFTGYNYGCIFFGVKDSVYSFGGTGFWMVNGMLRKYQDGSGEWTARRLNQTIPWYRTPDNSINSFYQLDTAHEQLYIREEGIGIDQSVQKPNQDLSHYNLHRLNLNSGNWELMGQTKDSVYDIQAHLPWGMLVNNNSIIDLHHNRYLKLTDQCQEKFTTLINGATRDHSIDLSFAIDSTLYFGNFKGRLDSFTIESKDLIDTGIPFFETREIPGKSKEKQLYWLVILILSAGLAYSLLKHKKHEAKRQASSKTKTDEWIDPSIIHFRSSMQPDLLDVSEKSLLQCVFNNSIKEKLTSLEDVNNILGTSGRTQEVQKRMRSIVVNGINEKMGIVRGSREPLICKIRSDVDKRSFEYYIKPENIPFVASLLEK